jgi:hypothetical protein
VAGGGRAGWPRRWITASGKMNIFLMLEIEKGACVDRKYDMRHFFNKIKQSWRFTWIDVPSTPCHLNIISISTTKSDLDEPPTRIAVQ